MWRRGIRAIEIDGRLLRTAALENLPVDVARRWASTS
jgi:hypothetical protein